MEFLDQELSFHKECHSKRSEISGLARDLMVFISKVNSVISSSVIKLRYLIAEGSSGTIKECDILKFKDIGEKPTAGNKLFDILVGDVDLYMILNNELITLKKNYASKVIMLADAITHGVDQAKFIEAKKSAEELVNSTDEKIAKVNTSIENTIQSLKLLLNISDIDIFNDMDILDIEQGSSISSFITLNNENCSKLAKFYNKLRGCKYTC